MRARHGARALCIVVLRTVSDPEGSSTKGEYDECRRLPGLHDGLVHFPTALPTFHLNHQDTKRTKVSRRSSSPLSITEVALHRLGFIYQTNRYFRKPNNYLVFLVPWW